MRPKTVRQHRLSSYVWGFLLIGLAIRGSWLVYNDVRLLMSSQKWVSTQAILETFDVYKELGSSNYRVKLAYVFQYNGVEYRGDQLKIPRKAFNQKVIDVAMAIIESGSQVEVYFNPEFPEESSLLLPEISYSRILLFGGGAVLFLWLGLFFLRKKNRTIEVTSESTINQEVSFYLFDETAKVQEQGPVTLSEAMEIMDGYMIKSKSCDPYADSNIHISMSSFGLSKGPSTFIEIAIYGENDINIRYESPEPEILGVTGLYQGDCRTNNIDEAHIIISKFYELSHSQFKEYFKSN